jgi:O-antigen/teichoic acid export membrane protein
MVIFMLAYVIWGFVFSLLAALLAFGKAGEVLLTQIIALVVFLPVLYLLLNSTGLIGAAVAQVIYFAVYAIFIVLFFIKCITVTNRKIIV